MPVLRPGGGSYPGIADRFRRSSLRVAPSTTHGRTPQSQMAAEASEAAAAQGAFWAMHDLLLEHQDELAPKDLIRYA